ncbi:hypothetical protein BV898_17982 [Hypsibius exemplaris]|uniref:Uncharacterized protein n=1 Tax=Hypsibius exemplaris TaxID=2072580 RepID=A0A9X6NPN1_HYPEX|nr:hypothetical protein BV898_17982 [Hypsibius exemplaris]
MWRYFRDFRRGRKTLGVVPSPGRSATAVTPRNIEAVDCYITENPRATWEEIKVEISIGSAALNIILHHELGLRKLCAKWVPHLLQEGKKQARVDFALKILSRCRKNPELFLRRILTEDKSWTYYQDPMTKRLSMMWVWECLDWVDYFNTVPNATLYSSNYLNPFRRRSYPWEYICVYSALNVFPFILSQHVYIGVWFFPGYSVNLFRP